MFIGGFMKAEIIILFLYTVSMGNLTYKYGLYRGTEDRQQIDISSAHRENKISYAEGCEIGIRYNCFVNSCSVVPIEQLVDYCYDRAQDYNK
jgi:hypothetical protein